jgi:hypothetical protein
MHARSLLLPFAVVALTAVAGCAASNEDEAVAADGAELRAMTPDEIMGEIKYGETVAVAYTATPRYRAFWFNGTKGDWLDATITSSTGHPRLWVTDDAFNEQPRGAMMALRKTGKFYIVVRDGDLADATLTVTLKTHTAETH